VPVSQHTAKHIYTHRCVPLLVRKPAQQGEHLFLSISDAQMTPHALVR
jgi:hypothetical protein